jgi:hypothetical protein
VTDLNTLRPLLEQMIDEYIDEHPDLLAAGAEVIELDEDDFSFEELEAVFEELSAQIDEVAGELQSKDNAEIVSEMFGQPAATTEEDGEESLGVASLFGEITEADFEQAAETAIETGDVEALQELAERAGGELELELTAGGDE